jgi:2-succinyl-5-enolpyruvyl-6-hydroxy-3-cyclohexene-1-carboxylate synthase
VAGFGIDGDLSTFLGQSVASEALNFLIIGDLAFFYDMNALGIRHLKNNIRIVLINNRGGGEFRLNTHAADQFGEASNRHIAAGGHFGDSAEGWVMNNHFKYIAVKNKNDLEHRIQNLAQRSDSPILMEVFTTMDDDADSLQMIISANDLTPQSKKVAQAIKASIPKGMKAGIKKLIGR